MDGAGSQPPKKRHNPDASADAKSGKPSFDQNDGGPDAKDNFQKDLEAKLLKLNGNDLSLEMEDGKKFIKNKNLDQVIAKPLEAQPDEKIKDKNLDSTVSQSQTAKKFNLEKKLMLVKTAALNDSLMQKKREEIAQEI